MTWQLKLKNLLVPRRVARSRPPRLPAGLYHYQRTRNDQSGYVRYHLRVEPDGSGLLIAGAAEILRLTPAATLVAAELLAGTASFSLRAAELAARGAVPAALIDKVAALLTTLGQPSGRFPIINLADPVTGEGPRQLLAPIMADVVPGTAELTCQMLDRLWSAGIPHVRFRTVGVSDGSEAQQALVRAVRHAEDLGMISGLTAPAHRLSTGPWLDQLADVGLDYAVIPSGLTPSLSERLFGPLDAAQFVPAVAAVRRREMCPVVEVPLLPDAEDVLEGDLSELLVHGVTNVEVFAIAEDDAEAAAPLPPDQLRPFAARQLRQVAARMEELSSKRAVQVVWLPPVRMHPGDTVEQLAARGPRTAGDLSIRVEANGDVIPPRGPRTSAGNLLSDAWDTLWRRPALARFRVRVEANTRCDVCPGLAVCAADCPAEPRGWADG